MSRRRLVLAALVILLVAVAVTARATGFAEYLRPGNLGLLRDWISGLGAAGPIVFIFGYAVATVAFLPGTPLTLLAGLLFGAFLGTAYAFTGAMIGAVLAFLVARYAARDLVSSRVQRNERLRRLDAGVERQGWRMLVITRLVPVFPFNLQNYAYGLTRVRLSTYTLVSGLCIVPGVAVYAFAGGSLGSLSRDENLGRFFIYLGVAAVIFVALSFVPGIIRRRTAAGEIEADESPEAKRETVRPDGKEQG
jgi:uncharacterized membrane protein YdjX (TVP38/TMEM64 family)